MKLIYLILFISSIVSNEVLIDLVSLDEHNVSIVDFDLEEKSEKEKTDSSEDENKIEHKNHYRTFLYPFYSESECLMDNLNFAALNPFIEIHCPPPEMK